jgi:hypothetical protein
MHRDRLEVFPPLNDWKVMSASAVRLSNYTWPAHLTSLLWTGCRHDLAVQIYLPFEAEPHYADRTGKQNCIVTFQRRGRVHLVVSMQKRIPIRSPIAGVEGGNSPERPQTDQSVGDGEDHADGGKRETRDPSGATGC